MKLTFTGTANVGKSTLIEDFLKEWPMYKKADNSYREVAKKNPKVKLNQEGDEDSQKIIRDALIDQAQAYSRDENILFDRCVLDNLVYTLWLNSKGKVSDLFVEQQLPIVKESLALYDILFFIPLSAKYPIDIVPDEDGQRDLDPIFREEIDNIFKAVISNYYSLDKRVFWPKRDCPAVIEILGDRPTRVNMIKLYVTKDGKPYGEEDSLLKSEDNSQIRNILQ